jgi:hypothetical protein
MKLLLYQPYHEYFYSEAEATSLTLPDLLSQLGLSEYSDAGEIWETKQPISIQLSDSFIHLRSIFLATPEIKEDEDEGSQEISQEKLLSMLGISSSELAGDASGEAWESKQNGGGSADLI